MDLSRFRAISERRIPSEAVTGAAAAAELERFVEDPNNPRTEFDPVAFKAFVDDVREHGVLQPVVVVPLEDGKLMIRWGVRRLRAAREIGLTTLPYVLQTDERQRGDFAQVSENEQREALTPMDLARFVERMVAKGMAKKDIATRLHKHAADITHLLSLATAPGFILELYTSGRCRQPEYLYELRKLWEKDASFVEKRCAREEVITHSVIEDLRKSSEDAIPRTAKSRARKRIVHRLENTSHAVSHCALVYQGSSCRIVRGLMVVIGEDGVERAIAGDALAELVLSAAGAAAALRKS